MSEAKCETTNTETDCTRRNFLAGSGVLMAAGAMALGGTAISGLALPRGVHAAGDETIQIALVGAGGRGCGAAANALSTAGPVKLVAVADIFEGRLSGIGLRFADEFGDRVDLPPERVFLGFDGYRKAIDCLRPGDVVLLATPPVFRPLHVEYAVSRGVHVFMEKPFATDAPGTRRIQAAAKLADETGVKIACGLMWRHCAAREALVERVRDGELGELLHIRGFRMHGFGGRQPEQGEPDLSYQLRCFHEFDWSGANVFIDFCIHNIDSACWAKGAWPVSCIGLCGRSKPDLPGQMCDTYYHEFTFADGSHLTSHGLYAPGGFSMYSDFLHGTKGSAVLMDSLSAAKCRSYRGQVMTPENLAWSFDQQEPNPYQVEHDLFFDAIRRGIPYNEGHRAAEANFASLLGRAATYSGQIVTWDQIVKSELSLCPNVDSLSWESDAPVKRGPDGVWPHPVPGQTVIF